MLRAGKAGEDVRMDARTKEMFLKWSQTEWYIERVGETKEMIRKAVKGYEKVYVSFSGGKDSTVLVDLVLKEREDALVVHWDYGEYYLPAEIRREIVENARKMGVKNLWVITSERYKELKREAINVLGVEFLGKVCRQLEEAGYIGFVGLREEESLKRRKKIRYNRDKQIVYPLARWRWQDVWGYIVANGLPYLKAYEQYVTIYGWDKARMATMFDDEFRHIGTSNVDGVLMWRFRNEPYFDGSEER